ncbi:potassium channel family protein [Arenimonas daejeonensis]|uniref:potassium channel family protein n=1 Tax=Arenimonas daejeonensis TaxID=370777 RepID=UPI001D14B3E6|nr:potassium channel family protein [Arenimonas daejeonensis]
MNLVFGIPVMLLCLVFQAVFITIGLRQYSLRVQQVDRLDSAAFQIGLLALVMFLMLLSNFIQMMVWALLFVLLDEFDTFGKAVYHSAVNFATLGYGDIVLTERWRMLGPLEAATGILMFGVSTSVMTAAIVDLMQRSAKRHGRKPGDPP